MFKNNMGKFKCPKCEYESDKWSVKRHIERKHKELSVGRAPTTVSIPPMYGDDVQAAETHKYASNLIKSHPQSHPYLNHVNQQPNTYPQRTAEMDANNTYYTKETRAPPIWGGTEIVVGALCTFGPTLILVGALVSLA